MKRAKLLTTALVMALAACSVPLALANAENNLEGIGISQNGDSVVVTISTTSECVYNVFLTESKPERIVVDLTGVVNNLPQKQFSRLPLHTIKSVRTSQYKSLPDPQARVVLDILRPIDFRNYRNGNNIIIKLPAIKDEVKFSRWETSASGGQYAQADQVVSEQVRPEPLKKVEKSEPIEVAKTQPQQVEQTEIKQVELPKPIQVDKVETQQVEKAKPTQVEQVETGQAQETKPAQVEKVEPQKVEKPEPKPAEKAEQTDPVYLPAVDKQQAQADEAADDKDPINPTQIALSGATTPQGIPVDTAPQRKAVEYTAGGDRDPFMPLIGTGKGKGGGLPSLENLKLVGVLEDVNINRALLEDAEGNGYILKPNDRIQSGYLVTVTESKAIFQISEYGWTRTVALELTIPEIK
jgi:hypothetical protein